MELDGSLETNLEAAIASAVRHRGHPVYPDTLIFWNDLLTYARQTQARRGDHRIDLLIGKLAAELKPRSLV
jgi:hypothetical protein